MSTPVVTQSSVMASARCSLRLATEGIRAPTSGCTPQASSGRRLTSPTVPCDDFVVESASENDAFIQETRRAVEVNGAGSLVVTDLNRDDLSQIWWAGSADHIRGIAVTLDRVTAGEVEYLAVRAPHGAPVAVGGIDYARHQGAGRSGASTHWLLRSLGIGTRLIAEAETRITQRGLERAVIGVEDDNTRARALYERLGYRAFGHEQESWEVEDDNGGIRLHVIECTLLDKNLT